MLPVRDLESPGWSLTNIPSLSRGAPRNTPDTNADLHCGEGLASPDPAIAPDDDKAAIDRGEDARGSHDRETGDR
tara:strand:- start:3012 stop:3236 length:225 start_codon:yes stop_codon:yes gene_type:complete